MCSPKRSWIGWLKTTVLIGDSDLRKSTTAATLLSLIAILQQYGRKLKAIWSGDQSLKIKSMIVMNSITKDLYREIMAKQAKFKYLLATPNPQQKIQADSDKKSRKYSKRLYSLKELRRRLKRKLSKSAGKYWLIRKNTLVLRILLHKQYECRGFMKPEWLNSVKSFWVGRATPIFCILISNSLWIL